MLLRTLGCACGRRARMGARARETHHALYGAAHVRSFVSSDDAVRYVSSRWKAAKIIGRVALAYQRIERDATAEPSVLFPDDTPIMEKIAMGIFMRCPEDPIDLPEFLRGADHAARQLLTTAYDERGVGASDEALASLEIMATYEALQAIREHAAQRRRCFELPSDAALSLQGVDVDSIKLTEVEYVFGWPESNDDTDAKTKQSDDPVERLRCHVQYDVTERLASIVEAQVDQTYKERLAFSLCFESDVSHPNRQDWVVVRSTSIKATPMAQ